MAKPKTKPKSGPTSHPVRVHGRDRKIRDRAVVSAPPPSERPRIPTRTELASILGISEATLARRAKSNGYTVNERLKLAALEYVTLKAESVLGDRDGALAWLRASNHALGDRTPLDVLADEDGAIEVLHVLGRIQHGLVS